MTPPFSPTPGTHAASPRVLIVDDNPSIHADFRKILCPRQTDDSVSDLEGILFGNTPKPRDSIHLELLSAHQGEEALEMVRRSIQDQRPFSLAFMDVRMPPGWDGIETISRIWEIDPAIQMVVCTAYSDYSWEEMRARLGQPESLVVLKKPFDNVEVQQLAHALTRKWQLNIQAESATSQLEEVIGYMRTLLEMEKRLAHLPIARSRSLRNAAAREIQRPAAEACQTPSTPAPQVAVYRKGTGICDRKQQLADILIHLKSTLENTFMQLRDTEMQLVQAEKMASLGRLSAGIMHEINNPLNFAITAVDLSARYAVGMKDEVRADYLENLADVKGGLLRISNIVKDLREFTSPQFVAPDPIDASHSLSVALRILNAELPEGIEVDNRIPQGFEVRAVSSRLTQVFLNLIQNSIDALGEKPFAPEIGPKIRFEASAHDGVKTLRVWDNGPGIPAGDCERVFDPFFTTKEAGRGTGLGLSICYRLLRDVGAELRVNSEAGAFCEFILTFPDAPEIVPDEALVPRNSSSTGNPSDAHEPLSSPH